MNAVPRLHEWAEAARIARDQLLAHKTRSLLTALGVIIGIVAVTLMGTAIKGIDTGFRDNLAMLGQDTLYIQQWPWRDVGDQWYRYRNRPRIQAADAARINDWIARNPDSALRVAVPTQEAILRVERGGRSASGVSVIGTHSDFALVNTAELLAGRFFTRTEELGRQAVVILGYDVARTLFPEGAGRAVGQPVRIQGRRFTVIGVLDRQGSFLGIASFDKQAIVPLAVLQAVSPWRRGVSIRVQAAPDVPLERAVDELTGLYRRIRGLRPGQDNNFEINRSEVIEEQLGPVKTGLALAGFFVTGLALFVGAIGIMNITFVSVKERTREIGTRRALGARRQAILLQFLAEAVAICLLGGLFGLGLAYAIRTAVAYAFPALPFAFSADLVLLACVLSVLTGVLSGLAPAWQAARLDPAAALRHE